MKKRLISLFLIILFLIPLSLPGFAEEYFIPTSLEAPQHLLARFDAGSILLRWTIPQSIVEHLGNYDGDLFYCVDWKVNDGNWHYDVPVINAQTYSFDRDEDVPYFSYVTNLFADENNVQEIFLTPWAVGLTDDIDIVNNTYTFRMRFAFNDYNKPEDQDFVTSPYSNTVLIGKDSQVVAPSKLDAPLNLKVEVEKEFDGRPYFVLNWTNPETVNKINQNFPIMVKADFKIGGGKWFSETTTHDWWGADPYETSMILDPVERQYADKIVIEGNVYHFRILYAYEPYEATDRVVSPFSNVAKIGIEAYENATEWFIEDLNQAAELGLITNKIKGNMKSDITREEFAELAVRYYEMVTEKKAEPHPTQTFLDCTNPEVLKAFNLNITYGVGDGTKFEPKSNLQRQQMAAMIERTLKACYPDIDMNIDSVPDFKDQADFAAYAIPPAKLMFKHDITVGDGKGNFGPKDNCSREQSVVFLVRAINNKDKYLTGN